MNLRTNIRKRRVLRKQEGEDRVLSPGPWTSDHQSVNENEDLQHFSVVLSSLPETWVPENTLDQDSSNTTQEKNFPKDSKLAIRTFAAVI